MAARTEALGLRFGHAGHEMALYEQVLGLPDRRSSEGTAVALAYDFGLWPDFTFEVRGDRNGVWSQSEFRRMRGVAAGPFAKWKWLREEVETELGAPTSREDWFPTEILKFQTTTSGSVERSTFGFDFGLLQRATKDD